MAIVAAFTYEQGQLLLNIERARAAGVDVGRECAVLYDALLRGGTYTAIAGVAVPVTEGRCGRAIDYLFDRAVQQGRQEKIKWAGVIE